MIRLIKLQSIQFLFAIMVGFMFYFLGLKTPPAEQLNYYFYVFVTLFSIKFLSFHSGKFTRSQFLFITVGGFAKLSLKTISQIISISYLGFIGFPIAYTFVTSLLNIIFLNDLELFENFVLDRISILEIFNISFFIEIFITGALVPYLLFLEINPFLFFQIDLKSSINIFKLELIQFMTIFTILMISQFIVYTTYRRIVFKLSF